MNFTFYYSARCPTECFAMAATRVKMMLME